jgi:hypothetical protein
MNDQKAMNALALPGAASLWTFLRHEFLFVMWALAEVALLTPVFLALSAYARYWPPGRVAALFLLIMLIPFNISRLGSALSLSIDRQRILLAAGLLVVIILAWRNLLYSPTTLFDLDWLPALLSGIGRGDNPYWTRALAIFIVMTILWWRGIVMVGRPIDVGNSGFRFRVGVLLGAVFVAGLAAVQLPWPVTPFILLFFFASLVGIVLTRVEQLELSQSGHLFPIGISWILVVVVAAASVAIVTGVATGIASGRAVQDLVGFLSPLWLALGFLAASVTATFSLLSVPIIFVLTWILSLFVGLFGPVLEGAAESLQLELPEPGLELPAEEVAQSTLFLGQDAGRILAILAMVFVILFVTLALRRLFRILHGRGRIVADRIGPFDGLERVKKPGIGRRLANRLGMLRRWRAAASIRRIYRQMCETAAGNGYARLATETPYEYLASLSTAWPDNQQETELITEAYVKVRYGEIPESRGELEEISAAWKVLAKAAPGGTETN